MRVVCRDEQLLHIYLVIFSGCEIDGSKGGAWVNFDLTPQLDCRAAIQPFKLPLCPSLPQQWPLTLREMEVGVESSIHLGGVAQPIALHLLQLIHIYRGRHRTQLQSPIPWDGPDTNSPSVAVGPSSDRCVWDRDITR